MKRLLIAAAFLVGTYGHVHAQYLQDVLHFSRPERGATARFKALGNAQTALGGDLSSISGNPAGLGFFNRSDFSVSLDYLSEGQKSTYFGTSSNKNVNRLGLGQIGVVFHLPTQRYTGDDLESGWLNFNIGIGHSKNNNFYQNLGYAGINPTSSFTHFLSDQRDLGNEVEGLLGWDSYLIDFNETNPNNVYHYPSVLERNNSQRNSVKNQGFQSETNISFGANNSNIFYVGASIGLSTFSYKSNQSFKELGVFKSYDDFYRENPSSTFLDPSEDGYELLESEFDMNFNYNQNTRGSGINGKLGIIYKPTTQFNLGLSYSTPTWYKVIDEANTFMDTYYYQNSDASTPFFEVESDYIENYLEYNLRTPGRIHAGASGIFGLGLITADVEYVDYSSMKFSASNALSSAEKENVDNNMASGVKSTYTNALNYRVGGEYRITPEFLARIGYAHLGSPYKEVSTTTQTYSGGLGYRYHNIYVDLTYMQNAYSYTTNPYTIDTEWWGSTYANPVADVKVTRAQAFLTVGMKF